MDELNEKTNGNQHLVPIRPHYVPATLDEAVRISKALFMSGAFNDIKSAEQAFAKILAGMELGIGPMAALMGIHFVQGKPGLSATLIGTLIQQSRVYSFVLKELSDQNCVINFYRRPSGLVGQSSFSMGNAELAGLATKDIWKKYPRNMLFARAISNGARWYCPEVFGGTPVYTPEELEGDYRIIESQTRELDSFVTQAQQAPQPSETEGEGESTIEEMEKAFAGQAPVTEEASPATPKVDNPAKRPRPEPPARFINVKALFAWLRDVAKISEKEALTVLGKKNQLDVVDPMASCLEVLEFFWPANPPEGKAPYDLTDPRD